MNVLVVLAVTAIAFKLAYGLYGRYVERVFDMDDSRPTPASTMDNSRDYVQGKWQVVFSHHFASIAGAGPIVGPTIAIVYGFYPSWLWVVLGAIFFGAVHDATALFVSLRERGRSIVEVAHSTMGKPGYALFIVFVLFMVVTVTAAFLGLTATALTSLAPLKALGLEEGQGLLKTVTDPSTGQVKAKIGGIASTSAIAMSLFSPLVGFLLYRRGVGVMAASVVAVLIASASVAAGLFYPVSMGPEAWMAVISAYVLVAAGIPVWLVLQPRDFINSFVLYAGIAALTFGLVVGGLGGMSLKFPAFNLAMGGEKVGLVWPMLFITVACGAISGFHSLIASGTTSKQIAKESHARRIGFGAMLLEGLLAVAVLLALGSALDFPQYMDIVFPSEGKSNPILAFSLGMGQLLQRTAHVPAYIGTVFGIIMVEGFLLTTLDTAVRLNRYLFEELWQIAFERPPALLRSYIFNAGLSVALMLVFAYRQAFLSIWPVFGSVNQLLAALSLVTVSVWLFRKGKSWLFTLLPAVFMLATTVASLAYLINTKYLPEGDMFLVALSAVLIALSSGIAFLAWKNMRAGRPAPVPVPGGSVGEYED